MLERSIADEDYRALTAFFHEVGAHLRAHGRILLNFGTTGDELYLTELIQRAGLTREELRRTEGVKDGVSVAYFVLRLTR